MSVEHPKEGILSSMASKYDGKGNLKRDRPISYSSDDEDQNEDYNEMHKSRHKSDSSPSSVSPLREGSTISDITKQGSTTSDLKSGKRLRRQCAEELVYDSLKGDVSLLRIKVEVNNGDGGYNVKLTRVPTDNKTMTEHAHSTAARLLSQGELLRKLGQKLLSQLEASYESEIYSSLNLI